MTKTEMQERGLEAAKAYCERVGMAYCPAPTADSTLRNAFYATEADHLVLISVKTWSRPSEDGGVPLEKVHRQAAERQGVRLDVIEVRVIGGDRALLRHHRAVIEGSAA